MNDTVTFQLIEDSAALAKACEHLKTREWLAIDTEFQRETTWFPKLALIQIATDEEVFCIDPLVLDDIDPLLDIIYDTGIVKVLHSARQDLEIFFNLRKSIPQPLIDTQVAAALLGYADQIGYASIVQEVLEVTLEKGQTRSNWVKRPLSDAQLSYAADDVYWLARIFATLKDQLIEKGRLHWLEEDVQQLTNPETYELNPENSWHRIRGAGKLQGTPLKALQALAAWRDKTAMDTNCPRNWLIRDSALIAIAHTMPETISALQSIDDLNPKNIRRYGEKMLELVRQSESRPAITNKLHRPPDNHQKKLADRMNKHVKDVAAELCIEPTLIAPRKHLTQLAMGISDLPVLKGWRLGVAGKQLLALFEEFGSATVSTEEA